MSETKSNETFLVAADVLVGNVLQEEPASFLPSEKSDNSKKSTMKNQKLLKIKNVNDTDNKVGNIASAAEDTSMYNNKNEKSSGNLNNNNSNNNNNTPTSSASTPVNSTYFGNRSNTNINGVKKSFEKRYNSISFSPNANLHSSGLNSSPILKPKKTLHVTNFTMNKSALRNLLLSFPGFKTVAFYQDYCFVVFADIESATNAAEQLLAKTKLKVNFSKADYIPNVVSPSSIGNPNSILHVTNYPTSTTETEMIEMYSSYPGYLHIHFSKNFSLVYYQDIASAKNVLQHMNQTTNFTTVYSIKNANNSPINMNNNYHNNVPNGPPPPFNPMMNNGYRNMNVNGGLVMANGYPPPPPPVSATAPTTSNFNANGVINHPHTNGVNISPNAPHNNSFIKYNNSSNNLATLANNTNIKGMNGFSMPTNGNSNSSGNLYGFNNTNGNMNSGPLNMNNGMQNNAANGMNYFVGMSKPMNLSPNMDGNKVFNSPYKNQNGAMRKQSEGADLSAQLLKLNLSRGKDDDPSNGIGSLIQSKSDSNINGLLNRKNSGSMMNALENNNSSGNNDSTNPNNSGMSSSANSPFFKKSSIYDDMNGLKSSNSNQLLSAGNYGLDRNEFMNARKLSNASNILTENNQSNNYSNYPSNKYMVPPDVTITPDYSDVIKGNGFNPMIPLQNYGNYSATQQAQPKDANKISMNDSHSSDMFSQMNYSEMNDPKSIFNRTLSDTALSPNLEDDTANTSMTINHTDKLHPSIQINNSTNNDLSINNSKLRQNSTGSAAFDKLSFMPLTMGGHGSVLNTTNNDSIRTNNTVKQHSLSSLDLFGMKNLYNGSFNSNSGSINSSNFSSQLLKSSKSELPFIPSTSRSNSTSPYIDFNNGNNLLSSGMANTSFTTFPSLMNKSKSFCAINSLNSDNNKNLNDLSFTSIFSNDKKDSNSSFDGGLLMKNSYGVESPKSMYEPGLKNLRDNDVEFEGGQEKSKSVGIIGESSKLNDKNNDTLDTDYMKVNNNLLVKDISSSYSDSSVNENDFIEFIASKRQDNKKEDSRTDNNKTTENQSSKANNASQELEVKELNNSSSHKSSISSSTSPTFVYSPIYNDKSELSIDEVIFNNGKVSSSSSTNQNNSKGNNLSYSTLINNSGNESFINSIKNLSSLNYADNTDNKKLKNDSGSEENKEDNDSLIKQLYAKIEQLQKENNELSKTRDYHLFLISKLENQLEMSRTENNNLKEKLNRL